MSCYKFDKDGNLVDYFSGRRITGTEAEICKIASAKKIEITENEYFFVQDDGVVEKIDTTPAGLLNVGWGISCAR